MHKTPSRLRNIRRIRTMNQEQLAQLAGVSQETISKAERGILRLRPDIQERIAAILGVARHELFPSPEPEPSSASESAEVIS